MAELSFKRSLGDIISNSLRGEKKPKAQEVGSLKNYAGMFGIATLTIQEQEKIELIFQEFSESTPDEEDLKSLLEISSEIKAINNQAIIMHGERIKRAQGILKKCREGAFTAWLVTTYGNRQTPYNFLQYYEFQSLLPKELQNKLDEMPRQAVYALASRDGEREKKELIVRNYKGEKKQEILQMIRNYFPLPIHDGRIQDSGNQLIGILSKVRIQIKKEEFKPTINQRKIIGKLIAEIRQMISKTGVEIDV